MESEKSQAKKFIQKVARKVPQKGDLTDVKIVNLFQTIVSQLPKGVIKKTIESDLEKFYDLFKSTISESDNLSDLHVAKSESSEPDLLTFSWKLQILDRFASLFKNEIGETILNIQPFLLSSILNGEAHIVAYVLTDIPLSKIRNLSIEVRRALSNFIRFSVATSTKSIDSVEDDSSALIRAYLLAYYSVVESLRTSSDVGSLSASTSTVATALIATSSPSFLYLYTACIGLWISELGRESITTLAVHLLHFWAVTTESTPSSGIRPLLLSGMIGLHSELSQAAKESSLKSQVSALRGVMAEQIQRLVSIHAGEFGRSNAFLLWRDIIQPVLSESEPTITSVTCPRDSGLVNAELLAWFRDNKPFRAACACALKRAVKASCEQQFPVKNTSARADSDIVSTEEGSKLHGKSSSDNDIHPLSDDESNGYDHEGDDVLFSLDREGDEPSASVDAMLQELTTVSHAEEVPSRRSRPRTRSGLELSAASSTAPDKRSRTRSGSELSAASSTAPDKRTRTRSGSELSAASSTAPDKRSRTRSGSELSAASSTAPDTRARTSRTKLQSIAEVPKSKAKSKGKK